MPRKQIGIIAERMFEKNKVHFIERLLEKRPKNRLDTCWWITSPAHQPIIKFLQTHFGSDMLIYQFVVNSTVELHLWEPRLQ